MKLGKDVGNGGVDAAAIAAACDDADVASSALGVWSSSESTVGRIRSMREFLPHFLAGGFG